MLTSCLLKVSLLPVHWLLVRFHFTVLTVKWEQGSHHLEKPLNSLALFYFFKGDRKALRCCIIHVYAVHMYNTSRNVSRSTRKRMCELGPCACDCAWVVPVHTYFFSCLCLCICLLCTCLAAFINNLCKQEMVSVDWLLIWIPT